MEEKAIVENKFLSNVKIFWILAYVSFVSFFVLLYFWSQKIEEDSLNTAKVYSSLYSLATKDNLDDEIRNFIFEDVIQSSIIPVIITDKDGDISSWRNIQISQDRTEENLANVKKYIQRMDKKRDPIALTTKVRTKIIPIGHLHYGDMNSVGFITYMPIILFGLTLIFAYASFAGFKVVKDTEHDKLFYGLAKETAHQLGTPLSSLWGWLELIKIDSGYNTVEDKRRKIDSYINEVEQDIVRLEKINNRFDLIGSEPEKNFEELSEIIEGTASYFKSRIPSNITIETDLIGDCSIYMNRTLIEWVFENFIKNSIDVLHQEEAGLIKINSSIDEDTNQVVVTVTDNGVGVRDKAQSDIFTAGYTTKKNGWGLGLTLVKRIVEVYHDGSVSLVESRPFDRTTFKVTFNR